MRKNNLKEFKEAIEALNNIKPEKIEKIHQELGLDYGEEILNNLTGFSWFSSYPPCNVLYVEYGNPQCEYCIWVLGTGLECNEQIPTDFYYFFKRFRFFI